MAAENNINGHIEHHNQHLAISSAWRNEEQARISEAGSAEKWRHQAKNVKANIEDAQHNENAASE